MRQSLLFLPLVLIMMQSCIKDHIPSHPDDRPGENRLNAASIIIRSSDVLSVSDSTVSIKKSSQETPIVVGSILIGAPSPSDSLGFMRKVVSVIDSSGSYTFATKYASLSEAFDELHIDTVFHTGFTMDGNLRTARTNELELSGEIFPGLLAKGAIDFAYPELHFKVNKSSAKEGISYDFFVRSSLNSTGVEFSTSDKTSIKWKAKNLPLFPNMPVLTLVIPVGGFPLPVPLYQKINFSLGPIEIGGKMKLEFNPSFEANMGVSYNNGNFKPINQFTRFPSMSEPNYKFFDPSAGLFIKATVFNPNYRIAPYNSEYLSFGISAPQDIEGLIQFAKPNYNLTYKSKIEAGFNASFSFFTDQPVSLIASFDLYKYPVSGNWKVDTAQLLKSHSWRLKNGPHEIEKFTTVACPNVSLFGFSANNALLNFFSRNDSLFVREEISGLCGAWCHRPVIENCKIVGQPIIKEVHGAHEMYLQIVGDLLQTDGSVEWKSGETLPPIAFYSKIKKINEEQLILETSSSYFNRKEFVFERP